MTHEHGNIVTALLVSVYMCFVVPVSSDSEFGRAEQTVWEVGFVLVCIKDIRLHISLLLADGKSPHFEGQ